MEKISILIPTYNSEKYIEKCLNSVISQTYPNIEIIIIDGGSTDKTLDIVKKYKNIKIYRDPKNFGLGYSRNHAIEKCETDLFIFLDSDDTLEKNCVELLYNKMISTNSDIVMGCCDNNLDKEIILDDTNKFDPLFNYSIPYFVTAWNKLYKREIFKNIKYPEANFVEDEATILLILNNINKMVIIPEKTYDYYKNPNGLSTTTEKNYMIAINMFYERHLFFKNTKYDVPSWLTFKNYVFTVAKLLLSKNQKITHLKKYFFKHLKLKYIRYISVKEILSLLFPKLLNT